MIIERIFKISFFAVLILIIISSPLFVGSVEPFSKMVLRLEILILFVVWLLFTYLSDLYELKGNFSLKFILLLSFIFFCIFQIIPLPSYFINFITPETGKIWESNTEIIRKFSTEYKSHFHTISIVPHYSFNMILGISCYVLLGLVISRTISSKKHVLMLLFSFAAILLIESLIGSYQFFTGNTAFGLEKKHIATGTFVNKNHFAGFLELTVPFLFSYLLYLLLSFKKGLSVSGISIKSFQTVILIFITGISLVVFIFSFSRMGYLSFILSVTLSCLIYIKISGRYSRKMLLPLIFIIVFLVIGISKSFEHFKEMAPVNESDIAGRATIYKDTLNAIKDFPILGTGIGTFKVIYPGYKTLEQANTINYAHNDYLQLALETGLVGFSLLVFALILFLKSSLERLKSLYYNSDYFFFYIKLGALCGVISILIHSICEFNLHIPSNAAYFAILIGIITCREDSEPEIETDAKAIPLSGKRRKYRKSIKQN